MEFRIAQSEQRVDGNYLNNLFQNRSPKIAPMVPTDKAQPKMMSTSQIPPSKSPTNLIPINTPMKNPNRKWTIIRNQLVGFFVFAGMTVLYH